MRNAVNPNMGVNVTGMQQLVMNLHTIKDKTLKKATRAGIVAGLTPLVKAIKTEVNASSWPPSGKREARQAVKSSVGKTLKKKYGTYLGRAGFAVGKASKAAQAKAHARHMEGGTKGSRTKAGVGVSRTNIHWFVLGTKRMAAKLVGIIPRASMRAGPQMLAAARKKIDETIQRDAHRMRK